MTVGPNMSTFNLNNSNRPNVTLTIQPSTSGTPVHSVQRMRFQNPTQSFQMGFSDMMGDGPGRRLRKNVANVRRHVDFVSTVLNHAECRLWQYGRKQRVLQQPDILYQNTALPVHSTPDTPVDCVLTKFIRTAMNKVKCPVYSVCWSPEGKRLITGCQTGEFTLWNGTAFNFETILQAHDSAIRALRWSSNEQWLLSADQEGYVKYWQPNMNNAHMFSAHKDEPVRGIAFAPTDVKFATASDDGTAKIWDFARYTEERTLRGHGSEVRCIDWHPTKGLVVTGSRDTQQPVKLWDPKSGSCLATLQEHKSSVMAVEFNRNGNWLLTGGRDHLLKMYDIRVMKEVRTFRAHKKEVISLAWHPVHEGLFASGGGDGSIVYWLVDNEKEIGLLEHAHDQAIWSMKWHPMGHILATGSNDNNTKFWARNRPGDTVEDIFGMSATTAVGHLDKEREPRQVAVKTTIDDTMLMKTDTVIPGMGLDEELYQQLNRETISHVPDMLLVPEDLNSSQTAPIIGAKRTLIKQPPAKKAQRQFERMWNNSKGMGGGSEDFSMSREDDGPLDMVRSHKGSLLGTPSTPSLLGKPSTGASLLGPPTPRMAPLPTPQQPPQSYNNVPPPMNNRRQNNDYHGHNEGRSGGYNNNNRNNQGQNWRNGPGPGGPGGPSGPGPGGFQNRTGDTDSRGPPPMEMPPTMPPKNGPVIPLAPQNMKFDKNGIPVIPPGLPPHMWPMPPKTVGGPPVIPGAPGPGPGPIPIRPPSQSGGDIDYRSAPGPSPIKTAPPAGPPAVGNDIDLRARAGPPVTPLRPPPGPGQDSWRSGPPGPSGGMRPPPSSADPRLDPRLIQRAEPGKGNGPGGAWMPQFDGTVGPNGPNGPNGPPPMQMQSQKSPGAGGVGGNIGERRGPPGGGNIRHQPY